MKLTKLQITKSSEIEPGIILTPAYLFEPYIVIRHIFDGEKYLSEGKAVRVDNHHKTKFWAVPLAHPDVQPVLICVDLIFDPEKFKVYKIEP